MYAALAGSERARVVDPADHFDIARLHLEWLALGRGRDDHPRRLDAQPAVSRNTSSV